MAQLIPSFLDDHAPPGEREVFNLLAAGPNEWMALHSLDLAPWNRGLRTEIDFILIIPDAGVLCIEVKSHEGIYFDGQRWHPDSIKRSPFKQACDGSHTFFRRLSQLAPQFRHVPIVHCCIFPRASFELAPNLSVQPWELMDSRAFRKCADAVTFCAALKDMCVRSVEADANLAPLSRRLSRNEIDEIVRHCVPVQKRRTDAREEILRRKADTERVLREQQRPVLQLSELNDRLVVRGPAGAGKTLIAIEVALRAAERGRRVALLCFNQLVGDWIARRIQEIVPRPPNLIVGRAIKVMAEMSGIQIPADPDEDFWEGELPQRLEERLTDPEFRAAAIFDYLVLDEAQDVLARPWLWQCISQFLHGGLRQGGFVLFGDFDHQVLSGRASMEESLSELEGLGGFVRWRLSENCRNYRIVGETAVQLSGLPSPAYSGYLRPGGGLKNYDIFFYEDDQAQLDMLAAWIREFGTQGYKPSELTLLSFRAGDQSAAFRLQQRGFRLSPLWQHGKLTSYGTVQAFKGMENLVVILTDVRLDDREFQRDLFYTGMTRATESVRVLCDSSSQNLLFDWISGEDEK